jgi:6-pyruvoyltetrahydropterin/6-carboxytetrahydropterin synthase
MVPCIGKYQHVITTPGDPTSELLALLIKNDLVEVCRSQRAPAKITRVRIWESPNCFAEITE